MEKYCIGVDLGGTFIKFGLFDLNGNLLEKWSIPTNVQQNGISILPDLSNSINNVLTKLQIEKSRVNGIGIGIPGPVIKDGLVTACVNLGWYNIPVEKELTRLTGLPVKAANDANTAALGEMWKGSAKGCSNLVLITLGTGVGGGVVIDNKIVPGLYGASGEFGHMLVELDETETCACGRKGCLQQYSSAKGIVTLAERILSASPKDSALRNIESLTAQDIFDAAKSGDELALETARRSCRYLGFAMASATAVLDPEVYIIGGGMSQAGQFLIDRIKKYYIQYSLFLCKDTEIRLATLGNDAGICGAARMML